jgi:osmoprotectant transport system substrate-binding protein
VRNHPAGLASIVSLLLAALLVACGGEEAPTGVPGGTVRFASYDFQENQILAEVYAEAARRRDVPVMVQHGAGTREVVLPALEQGVVDVVIDYVGTATAFARTGRPLIERTSQELHAALDLTLGPRGVTVLAAAEAQDQNGFAVTTAFASDNDVRELSELTRLAPDLTFGGPPECPDRPFCLPGLREVYDLEFGAFRTMGSRAETVEALLAGEIDVGLLETTDARLAVAPVVLLGDDRLLQPPENVVPLVRTDVLDEHRALQGALEETAARLTTADVVRLNRAVELEGLTPAEAAERWWADA